MLDRYRKWKLALATLGGAAVLHLVLAACGQRSSSVGQCQTGNCGGAASSGGAGLAPSGAVVAFGGRSAPDGWLACDGSAVSRTQYASLFAAIGTASGDGDGLTTFNLPDYRGRFLRGIDEGTHRDPDAATRTAANGGGNVGDAVGSLEGDALGSHNHPLMDPGHGHPVTDNGHSHLITDPGHGHTNTVANSTTNGVWAGFPASGGDTACFNTGNPPYCYANGWLTVNTALTGITGTEIGTANISIQDAKTGATVGTAGTSQETRPANVSVVWIIKT